MSQTSGNRRRSCLEAWQEIDLQNLQLSLDEQASKLADFREACQASRRTLAGSTKNFKKLQSVRDAAEDSVIRTKLPKLLREYQEEVDRLTQRAKFSENCFLVIYRLIREAPDPGKDLNDAERKVFEAETKLSKYLADEGRIRHEKEELEEQLKQKDKELEVLQRQHNDDLDFETELEKRIEQIKQNYKDELLDLRAKSEEDSANVSMQLELVQNELEKQVALAEQLKEELTQARASIQNKTLSETAEIAKEKSVAELNTLKAELSESKKEVAVLKAENDALKTSGNTAKDDYENQIEELNYLVKDRTEIIHEMQKNFSGRPTIEEHQNLRRQLLVMQNVLYNGTENEELNESKHEDGLDGLEAWLLRSNKDLKIQLVEARKNIDEQKRQLERLKETEIRLGEALQDQSELAKKLESDLIVAGNAAAVVAKENSASQEQTSASAASTPSGKELQETHAQRAVKSMLDAVCAQRDRLRTSVRERDEKIEELSKKARTLREKKTKVEEDNMQLYQRIRFLQNYKQSERSTLLAEGVPTRDSMSMLEAGTMKSPDNRPAASKGLGRGVEHRYRKIYESIDENPW
eukprot:CAMPEP_0204868904 /NCGR_PEP_ID=MMETSP1348-20121228/28044_1 /ASSEMBLY_ACC=CAM_ASM_000700 /TAXON_ID=215587 /ORGANISM="Aplanochytrium stocchinoi, Strain GSBS06" /LENGTH=580 /DNA_ID=CAMNT_0052022023 /DNA_START=103 /DNA_END=1842 /DNA_ORIENTATION=-